MTPPALPPALEDGIIVWDPDGVVISANAAAARMIGVPAEAMVGAPSDATLLYAVDGEPLSHEQFPAIRVARTGNRVDQELGLPTADGEILWVSYRSAPLEDGTIASVFTPIRHDEARARASARIATLVEESPDLIWIFDAHGQIEYASPSVHQRLGWRPEDLIGRLWRALVHPSDYAGVKSALVGARPEEPRSDVLSHRVRAADGTWRWLEGQAVVRFKGGMPSSMELIARDVTKRHAAEEEGRRLATQLEALVAGVPDGIIMIGADERLAVVNDRACTLLGIDTAPADLAGGDPQLLLDRARELMADPETGLAQLRSVIAAGEVARFLRVDLADGRSLGYDHVPLADGGRVWMFRDTTVLIRLESEHVAARDDAIQAARDKDEFLATMSHEIKTPLSGIAGAAELLLDGRLDPAQRELAQVVADAAQALTGLLGDVLDVSRAEAGRAATEHADYDVRALLASVVSVLRPSLRERPLTLTVDVDPTVPPALRGDAARIRQILLNLASNAVKYTQAGEARLRAAVAGDRLRITVSDTGPGIAEADLPRLFEPWTRGHGRAWAGTGLGLSIARRLARAMGGDVTAVSALGAGSAFTLELPLAEGVAAPVPDAEAAPSLGGGRVLFADDDAALRLLVGRQLARLGIEATAVEHGQAAVDAAAGGCFDAILLDLRMPVMGGLEAARAIRVAEADSGRPAVPLLALTADTAADDVARCHEAGMDGHLAKPVSLPALRGALARHIPPVLDEALLDELAESLGGPEPIDQMLAVFHAALPERLERLRTATAAPARREAAHALRSPAAGFGIARLAARLRVVEAAARRGALADLTTVLEAAGEADAALRRRLGGAS